MNIKNEKNMKNNWKNWNNIKWWIIMNKWKLFEDKWMNEKIIIKNK